MKPQLSCIFVCLALAQIGFAQPQNKVTQRIPTTIEVDVKNEQVKTFLATLKESNSLGFLGRK